tara:strand:- start:805 stop:993 length:189 start_codon:yes stop_codon:yes gene_type:complete
MDFACRHRARTNGIATTAEATDEIRQVWPKAQGAVLVTIEQAYRYCSACIRRLELVEGSVRG